MRIQIWRCDQCKKVLSDFSSNIAIPHISIEIVSYKKAGWANPREGWNLQNTVGSIIHFCNGKCLGKFFDARKLKKQK